MVRGGDFLEERTGFGEETMHYGKNKKIDRTNRVTEAIYRRRIARITVYASLAFLCAMLCGCTRREQLVLDIGAGSGTAMEEGEAGWQLTQESQGGQTLSGQEGQTPKEQDSRPEPVSEQTAKSQETSEKMRTDAGETEQQIFVHVCGAVNRPDVYELPAGSRVYEAVKKAGGFAENADESYVNQAQVLPDGAKLVIPTVEEARALLQEGEDAVPAGITGEQTDPGGLGLVAAVQQESAGNGTDAPDGKININTASEAELCNIPGIGATRAAAIAAYRKERGSFSSIEDIMKVSGIKEGTFAKIKDSIKVD